VTAADVRGHNIRVAAHRDRAKCTFAVQANLAGFQPVRVEALPSPFTGQSGTLAVRVGQLLVYLEDVDALASVLTALKRAVELQQEAFGGHRQLVFPVELDVA
jgi:hypothetical protein